MADAEGRRARYPELESRSLVYWAGDKGGPALPLVDTAVTSTIAMSLANASRNQELIREARGRGLAVMLDLEAWRGQLPPTHRMRKSRRPPGLKRDERVDPDAGEFAAEWRHAVTEQSIEAQVRAGATILTTAAHFSEDPLGIARANDVRLARDAIAEVDRRRLRLPGPGEDKAQGRHLYATIAVVPRLLSEEAVGALVATYATLAVDGFMIGGVRAGLMAHDGNTLLHATQALLFGLAAEHPD